MSKHTPGPWSVVGTTIVANPDIAIAVIEDDGGYEAPQEEQEANARLIAAAPDLLSLLQDAVTGHTIHGWRDAAKAAIAKARGEEGR